MFAHTFKSILSGAVFTLAASASAQSPLASAERLPDDRTFPGSREGAIGSFEERLQAEGFRLVEIEYYASVIEIEGYDARGNCMEVYVDRKTRQEMFREFDDSCDRRRGGRRGRDD